MKKLGYEGLRLAELSSTTGPHCIQALSDALVSGHILYLRAVLVVE